MQGLLGPQGKPLIVLENGNYGNWDESLGIYVDSGVLAAATVDIEGVPVTFTEAALRENILSEETIPTVFGKIKKWFSSLKALAFKDKVDYTTDIDNTPIIPSSTSQLSNNSGFITNAVNDLVNYYVKSETYTKTEVQNLISAVSSLRIRVWCPWSLCGSGWVSLWVGLGVFIMLCYGIGVTLEAIKSICPPGGD